jgi:hypothetical protein
VGGAIAMAAISEAKCLELIEAIAKEPLLISQREYSLNQSHIGADVLELDRQSQAALVMAMKRWNSSLSNKIRCFREYSDDGNSYVGGFRSVSSAMLELLKRKLPFTQYDVIELLEIVDGQQDARCWSGAQLFKITSDYLKENQMTPELQFAVQKAADDLQKRNRGDHKYGVKLRKLLPPDEAISMP